MSLLNGILLLMKMCIICKTEKPIEAFGKASGNKDGLNHRCKECYAAYMREWSRRNSDVVNARVRDYYKRNREEILKKDRARYYSNWEHRQELSANWKLKNPERWQAHKNLSNYRRRARAKTSQHFLITVKEFQRLYRQPCTYCGTKENITIDHVIPLSRGGRNCIGNLVPACGSCNSIKNARFIMEWRLHKLRFANKGD